MSRVREQIKEAAPLGKVRAAFEELLAATSDWLRRFGALHREPPGRRGLHRS